MALTELKCNMQLIIMYGPPASGKLTIAQELAQKTGYKLFHNHLTVDLLKNFMEWGTPEFFELNQKMKLDILEACAKQKVSGLIMTFVYDKKTDDPYINSIDAICKRYGVDLKFIRLACSKEEILKRVSGETRKNYKKVTTAENLEVWLKKGDFFSEIDNHQTITINNTNIDPITCAKDILEAIK